MAKLVAGFEYTDAELLALFRECLAKISVRGQSYMIAGKTYTSLDVADVLQTISALESRVAASSSGPIGLSSIRRVRAGGSSDPAQCRTGDA